MPVMIEIHFGSFLGISGNTVFLKITRSKMNTWNGTYHGNGTHYIQPLDGIILVHEPNLHDTIPVPFTEGDTAYTALEELFHVSIDESHAKIMPNGPADIHVNPDVPDTAVTIRRILPHGLDVTLHQMVAGLEPHPVSHGKPVQYLPEINDVRHIY